MVQGNRSSHGGVERFKILHLDKDGVCTGIQNFLAEPLTFIADNQCPLLGNGHALKVANEAVPAALRFSISSFKSLYRTGRWKAAPLED